tara:strand:+ start:3224 stop:4051 length:828 start_codon:yes stop_codon:yes gene_type:complete
MLWNKAIGAGAAGAAGGAGGSSWDISAAVLVDSFSVASKEASPTSVFFKPDGTKMYVTGFAGDDVNEYNLGAPWDVSSAVYLQSLFFGSSATIPRATKFNPDGTKMYVLDAQLDRVSEFDVSTAWDVATATLNQKSASVFLEESNPWDMFFKPDGTKMYLVGDSGDEVNEYDLGTPWNISTLTYLQNFSIAGEASKPRGVFFKPDGTKMYMVGDTSEVYQYNLATAWDVSSAAYLQNFGTSAQELYVRDVFFKPDGTKMYLVGFVGVNVLEYDVG